MTYEEKVKKILEQRETALLGIDGVLKSEAALKEERDLNEDFLFGDGTNLSPINILEMYYEEMNVSVGRTSSAPALQGGVGSSEASWKSRFQSAITLSGDGSIYLDSDGDGIADNEVNSNSIWFTNNSDNGETNNGIYNNVTSLIAPAIGTPANQTGNDRTNGVTYTDDLPSAQAAALAKAQAERGTALLGRRSQNSDEDDTPIVVTALTGTNEIEILNVESQVSDGEGGYITQNDYTIHIGSNGQDHINYYTGTERTNFENALTNLRNAIRDTYKPKVTALQTELQKINNGENYLFDVASMNEQELIDDLTNVNNLISALDNHINDLDLQLEYFTGFTGGVDLTEQTTTVDGAVVDYNKTDFDDRLNNQVPSLVSAIENTLSNRIAQIETAISLGDSTKSLRKWIVFWAIENIGKPSGPLVGLKGISEAYAQAEAGVKKANNSALVLFGTNRNLYISTPTGIYTFQDNVFDDNTWQVVKRRNAFGWVGPVYCNMFKIYRKNITRNSESPNNDNWSEVNLYDAKVEIDENSGIINQLYIDEDPNIKVGDVYLYRVSGFDTNETVTIGSENISPQKAMLDTFDNQPSGSKQSRVYNEDNLFNFSSMNNGVFTFENPNEKEVDFGNDDYIAIVNSTGLNGFYKIESIDNNVVTLTNKDISFSRGQIAKAYGVLEIVN